MPERKHFFSIDAFPNLVYLYICGDNYYQFLERRKGRTKVLKRYFVVSSSQTKAGKENSPNEERWLRFSFKWVDDLQAWHIYDKVSANTASSESQKLTVWPGKSILCNKKHLKIAFFLCARIWTPNGWHQVNFRPTPENFGVWRSKLAQSSNLSQISQIISVEKNLSCGEISDFCKEFEQLWSFIESLCRFCSKFVWRQICVEKKRQIWGLN